MEEEKKAEKEENPTHIHFSSCSQVAAEAAHLAFYHSSRDSVQMEQRGTQECVAVCFFGIN